MSQVGGVGSPDRTDGDIICQLILHLNVTPRIGKDLGLVFHVVDGISGQLPLPEGRGL